MNSIIEEAPSGKIHPKLAGRLRDARLFGCLTEVNSSRFMKYVMQPKHILRNGWLLAPDLELDQSDLRAYVLGSEPAEGRSNPVGQRLVIDRNRRVATLFTYVQESMQEIRVDLESMDVLENRFTA